MRQPELEKLSREVAEKYGIDAFIRPFDNWDFQKEEPLNWLHDDIGRCATLAIEHGIDLTFCNSCVFAGNGYFYEKRESYADHANNKVRATCVAILKALKDKP